MDSDSRRWAIALGVSGVLLISVGVLANVTASEEDGANIGGGLIGILGFACALSSIILVALRGRSGRDGD